MSTMNIQANRNSKKYDSLEIVKRIFWGLGQLLFRFSPRPFFAWRRFILRLFGAKIGKAVNFYSSTRIYFPWNLTIGAWSAVGEDALIYNLGPVVIGEKVTISQRVHVCAGTHDYTKPDMPLVKTQITIGSQSWICADAFIGPGVNIGEAAIVGARSVVVKDVPAWHIVGGNPAKIIKERPRFNIINHLVKG